MSKSFIEVVSRLACSGADDCEIKDSPLLDKASFSLDELLRSDCAAYALGLDSESQKTPSIQGHPVDLACDVCDK